MSSPKTVYLVEVILKICVIIALVVGAATRQEYSYYSFLRWFVMISFIYFSYHAYNQKHFGLLIFFVAIAIMFNSFHKVIFQKGTWHLIDYAVAVFTALTVIYDLRLLLKGDFRRG